MNVPTVAWVQMLPVHAKQVFWVEVPTSEAFWQMSSSGGGNDGDAYFCKKGAPCIRGVEICEGHVPRIFLKECNIKCRCNSDCGNRVVQ